MGGKALQQFGIVTERKNTEEFYAIAEELRNKLYDDLQLETAIVKFYHIKPDHGDLDLLIKIDHKFHNKSVDFRSYITETFNPNGIHYGGGVYSFDYNNFQIDFILVRESNWAVANTYFSYDPCGNIMGKTFHKFNLSYGWEGLYYKFRNFNGRNSQNILISKNPRKIFEFGGYDYDRFLKGFDALEEIFEFVSQTKYFDTKIFQFENLRHVDKKRNRKRKSYNTFLNYLNDNDIKANFDFSKQKDVYIPVINDFFPEANFVEKLSHLKRQDEINRQLAEKFNGNIIMEWLPNLKGKELGDMISKFKKRFGSDYNDFILKNNINKIKSEFIELYNKQFTENNGKEI